MGELSEFAGRRGIQSCGCAPVRHSVRGKSLKSVSGRRMMTSAEGSMLCNVSNKYIN